MLKYKAKTKWAGLVWIWGNTLNKIPANGLPEISFEKKRLVIPRDKIKERSVRQKKLFNKLTGKEDTQYGFEI